MSYKKGETFKTAFEIYTIKSSKGSGGSGEVYEATDPDGVPFAIKVLYGDKATRSRLKRFKNEIHFCSKTSHHNIVAVLGHGITAAGESFYVMPLYSGTLRDLLKKQIPSEAVLPYFSQILNGVEAAHLLSVWHRDLKPENILFSAAEDTLVIADFGIAHFEEEELLTAVETRSQDRLANFEYAAPEQRRRGQAVDSKADIYALGLMLNEMFTSSVPHGTGFRKVSEVAPNFAYVDGLVELMLRHDPGARPTIEQVKRELNARGNEFVTAQRLNSLKSEVIPETEVDNPFVRNPIRITGVNYHKPYLIYKLSAAPSYEWTMAFRDPRAGYSSYLGKGPESFNFHNDEAHVHLGSGEAPEQMTIYTKTFVQLANQRYAEVVAKKHRDNLATQQQLQRQRIQEAEERQRMLARIAEIKL